MTAPITVLVADDHPLFLDGLRNLIIDSDGLELVGTATNGNEAVSLAGQLQPDVVLMDLRMPGLRGIEATRNILAARPSTAVLVLTMVEDDSSVFAAMRAGARGYTLKGASGSDIVEAIRVVASGKVILGTELASRVDRYFARPRTSPASNAFPQLSPREHEILELLATGRSNGEIARDLVLSEKTVRNNVSSILAKMQAGTRTQLMAAARDAGLGAS